METIDKIGRYIEKVEIRAERNRKWNKQGSESVGKQAGGLLDQSGSILRYRGESPELTEDLKALKQTQTRLDSAASRTEPNKVRSN